MPRPIEKVDVPVGSVEYKIVYIDKLLVSAGFAASRSEAMRLVKAGAVTIKDGDLGWEGRDVWGWGPPNQALMPFGRVFQMRVGRMHKGVRIRA
jgi:hypothetical protein